MSSAISDFSRVAENDKNIVPTKLQAIVNMPKTLEVELLNDVELRNKIINFAQVLKVAMSFRANTRQGCSTIIPWKSTMTTKCISFNDKADLFYYLTYKVSYFNKVLTIAVKINKTLKLHLHYIANNRIFCPKYKIVDQDANQVAYFNQRINNNIITNNLMRAMLSGKHGLPSNYKLVHV